MIDSHCHLEMPDFESDFQSVLDRMRENGVTHAISIGSLAQNERIGKTMDIVNSRDFIYTTLGVHPKSPYTNFEGILKSFENYYSNNREKIVAVGEIGLDYFFNGRLAGDINEIKRLQEELFRFQIELALTNRLPIIVHIRDAYKEALDILKSCINAPAGFFGGVIHCFSADDLDIAMEFIKLGFFISFSANITYKKNEHIRLAAKNIPDEKILTETDSPYLAPQAFRGKRNEPSYVRFVLQEIAGLKGIEQKRFDELTVQNTVNLFSIDGVQGFYPAVAYKIRNSVYINLTNKCTNRCSFCPKYQNQNGQNNFNVRGYNLELKKEPSASEVISSVFHYYDFNEAVFCGLGEPTLRLATLKDVAKAVKEKGGGGIKVRLDTDGLAGAVYNRNIAHELEGLIDSVSVSLNAHNSDFYDRICLPNLNKKGTDAYAEVISFIKESKKYIKEVTATAVDLPGLDVPYASNLAHKLGVKFKLRKYNDVG